MNLEIKKGEFLVIFGPNGAGKTTLIKIMSTLLSPNSGSVVIDGFDIKENPIEIRKRIGVISHETYLYPDLTATENLKFFGKMYNLPNLDRKIKEILKQVGLQHRAKSLVRTFSRGMKQRLSVARAIIHDPPILFLDEPFTGLDQYASTTFEKIFSTIGDKTTIMVSHNLERGLKMCSRAIILNKGQIVYSAKKDEITLEEFKNIYEHYVSEVG
ncbi:MAG: ABC transporter ATP-binding protein [Methanosarcinales archaeon]